MSYEPFLGGEGGFQFIDKRREEGFPRWTTTSLNDAFSAHLTGSELRSQHLSREEACAQ